MPCASHLELLSLEDKVGPSMAKGGLERRFGG